MVLMTEEITLSKNSVDSELIFSGALLGSVVTLVLKWLADLLSGRVKFKQEMKMLAFQSRLRADEAAMAWLQEALDNYLILQAALKGCDGSENPFLFKKLMFSVEKSKLLFESKEKMLNPVYMFRSFVDLEEKFGGSDSLYLMNEGYEKLGKLSLQFDSIKANGGSKEEEEKLREEALRVCRIIGDAIDCHIGLIAAIQERIRGEYQAMVK